MDRHAGRNAALAQPRAPASDDADQARPVEVPVGTSVETRARMDESAGDDLLSLTHYSVKNGETLPASPGSCISAAPIWRKPTTWATSARLVSGQELVVPAGVP